MFSVEDVYFKKALFTTIFRSLDHQMDEYKDISRNNYFL